MTVRTRYGEFVKVYRQHRLEEVDNEDKGDESQQE